MSELPPYGLKVKLPNGQSMTYAQVLELARLIELADEGTTHWHMNNCGCCLSLHGPDYAYVIGPDGESELYPERGCGCE